MTSGKEKWAFYKATMNELPQEEDLQNLKGIVFPGSKYSVYDETIPWIEPLKAFVRKVYIDYPHIKLLGVCFGHQLIAESLGGTVQKMKPGVDDCMFTGKEKIWLCESFNELPYV